MPTTPPPTRTETVTDVLHGVEINDPYRWLEDQDSEETRRWIAAQQEYTKSLLGAYPGRDAIQFRLEELMKIDSIGAPSEYGGWYFYSKRLANQEQAVLYRRKGLDGADEILLDPNTMSEDKTVTTQLLDVSPDGKIIVYGIRQGGKDEVAVHLMDTDTKQDLPDVLPEFRYFGGVSLVPNKSGLYYGRMEDDGPRVRHHVMGTEANADTEIFGAGYDSGKIIGVTVSENGNWLLLEVAYGSASQKSDLYVQNIAENGPIFPLVNDIEASFSGHIVDDTLYMETTWDAPNGRIFKVDLKNPAKENWKEIIPTGDNVLRSFSPVGHRLFVNYLEKVTSRVKIFTAEGEPEGEITLPTLGTIGGIGGWWDKNEAFFTFTSFATPSTIYRYDIAAGTAEVWARNHVPIDPTQFTVEQVFYASKDGTQIPMFLIYANGLKRDGTNPTLLMGYGGFNVSLTPYFSSFASYWAEKGGVFAIANLRGGGEFGESWHQAGMLANKQNVFDDFLAAAEYLISNGFTQPAKLAIEGGSNGGLLVGAAVTQRPELFGAVICSVPLLDMVRYHQFLVASFWVPEYGSSDDPEQFKTLYVYSPYHHVRQGEKYPAVLFVTGDADTRVAPLHARKMAALMQAATGSDKPILLHYDTKSGHSGGKPVNKIINDLTDEICFLFEQLGME